MKILSALTCSQSAGIKASIKAIGSLLWVEKMASRSAGKAGKLLEHAILNCLTVALVICMKMKVCFVTDNYVQNRRNPAMPRNVLISFPYRDPCCVTGESSTLYTFPV